MDENSHSLPSSAGNKQKCLPSRTMKGVKTAFCYGVLVDKVRRHSLLCFQGVALSLFVGLTLGAAFWFRSTPVSGEDNTANTPNMQSAASLFIDSQERVIAPDLLVVQDSSFLASTPPLAVQSRVLGVLVGLEEEDASQREGVVEYIVEEGDSLASVAAKFGISLETIMWANDLKKGSVIKPGQNLVILPVDGLVHHVKNGDTIGGIARLYQAKTEDVLVFNDLSSGEQIYIGDILIIPNGKMPVLKSASTVVSAPVQVPVASSYFMCPLGSSCGALTQGLHWYNAVDIDANCGDPIYAAAAGKVLKVALTSSTSRWALNGAGNHITILHPNGTVTYYGHVRASLVIPGQQVSQGQMIATIGGLPGTPGAGLSTGCHIHFGVNGGKNPFAR